MTRRSFALVILGGITAACKRKTDSPLGPTLAYTTETTTPQTTRTLLTVLQADSRYKTAQRSPSGNNGAAMIKIDGKRDWLFTVNDVRIGEVSGGKDGTLDITTWPVPENARWSVTSV